MVKVGKKCGNFNTPCKNIIQRCILLSFISRGHFLYLARVESKIFVFAFKQKIRKKFFSLFCKKSLRKVAQIFVSHKVFPKIVHSQCGSGSRSQMNVYPDPKRLWMLPKNHLKKCCFWRKASRNKNIRKKWTKTVCENFREN
jgi:hypothetical protein